MAVRSATYLAGLLVFGAWIGACGGDRSAEAKTLAVIDGVPVTTEQFDAYLAFKRLPADDAERLTKVFDEYLRRGALASAIDKHGKLDAAAMEAALEELRREMLISRYFEKFLDEQVSDQAIKAYYDAHTAEMEERKVHVAHLLFRTHPKMAPEERQAKLTAARDAHAKLVAGADLATVADELSEDRVTAKKGGDLGWIGVGGVDPAFSEKVFSMKAGELSEPFESGFGYHVVKVLDAPQTVRKPLEAVQGDIRYKLRAEAKTAEVERLLALAKIERKASPAARAAAQAVASHGQSTPPALSDGAAK